MKANVLDNQRASGRTVLESQSAVLLSGYVPDPTRLAWVFGENRIVSVKRGAFMPKIVAEFSHSQGAVLDYGFDWKGRNWLAPGETIVASNWVTVGNGPTLSNPYNANGITTVVVAGLVLGQVYRLINTITTSAGRTDSRVLILSCNRR